MNIILSIHPFNVGGAERQVIELASGLKIMGHSVRICSLSKPGPLSQVAINRGIFVDCIQKQSKYDLTVIPRLAEYIKTYKTDVLQCFLFGADVWGTIAGRLANVPVLLLSDRAGGRANNPKEYNIIKYFNKIAWHFVDGIISNTTAGKNNLCDKFGVPKNKVFVVHNGISPDRFKIKVIKSEIRKQIGLKADSFVVVITGTIKPIKNHDMFLRTVRAVCSEKNNIEYVVVGDGENLAKMMRMANSYGVSESMKFLGQQTDIPEILAACDLGVLTSHWEGFPNAIMEYMAVGLPVVSTKVGGVTDLVDNGVTGYLTCPDDATEMAQYINKLYKNPALTKKMGQAGKNRVFQEFNYSILAAKMDCIYSSIIENKKANEQFTPVNG